MPNSHTSSDYRFLYIPRHMIFCLSSMVNLPKSNIGVFNHHILHYLVILLKPAISILFLHEVNTNSPGPVQFANLLQIGFNFLLSVRLFEVEDKTN